MVWKRRKLRSSVVSLIRYPLVLERRGFGFGRRHGDEGFPVFSSCRVSVPTLLRVCGWFSLMVVRFRVSVHPIKVHSFWFYE